MALQVWLPFISDLRQQGIGSVSAITLTSGNELISGGKIGNKAIHLTKLQTILGTSSCMSGKKQMSWALWVKVNTAWETNWLDGIRWISTDGSTTHTSRQEFYTICTYVGTWYQGGSISAKTFVPGEWTHLAATFDYESGKVAFYINGVLQGSTTNLDTTHYCRGDFYIGDNGVNIVENDVRIYDHCLSPMEIKELSKGLVLHYPLNRGGWGQENLLLNTNTPATWSQGVNSSNYAVHDCFKTQSPVPSLFSVDELITISFDWSTTATGGNFHVECGAVTPWVWGTVISSKGTRNSASNYIDINASNQSGHVEITFKITSSQTGAADTLQWLRIRHDGADTANKTFTISNAKLERGSIATPWCPNSSDALAVTMTLNGTTEYDCSGFCNNGTRVGTFEWTSDTPKYNVSTNFDGSGVRIHSAALPTETQTISVWAKTTKNKSTAQCILGDSASGICMFIYGGGLITYFRGSAGGTGSRVTFGNEYKENDWNHFVVVKTGDMTRDAYCNGVKLATTANNYYTHAEGFWVGARNANNQLPFYGQISDIRAYVTALSADDVKSLYQNSAYIDSSGNVYGAVHEEG